VLDTLVPGVTALLELAAEPADRPFAAGRPDTVAGFVAASEQWRAEPSVLISPVVTASSPALGPRSHRPGRQRLEGLVASWCSCGQEESWSFWRCALALLQTSG
jgi:hypothetical protein